MVEKFGLLPWGPGRAGLSMVQKGEGGWERDKEREREREREREKELLKKIFMLVNIPVLVTQLSPL